MPFQIEYASKEQKEYILNTRRSFNQNQLRMAVVHGNNMLLGNASTLPKDVWGLWDTDGLAIQRDELAVYNDLTPVTKNIPIGKLVHFFQQISDSSTVNTSMDGRSKALADQPEFSYVGTPVPIYDSTYKFGWRQMKSAESEGVSLEAAGRLNSLR